MKAGIRSEIEKCAREHAEYHALKRMPGQRSLLHMKVNCFECYLSWFTEPGADGQEFNIQASIGQEDLARCYTTKVGLEYKPGPWNVYLDISAADMLPTICHGQRSLIPYAQLKTAVPEFLEMAWTSFFQPYTTLDGFLEGLNSTAALITRNSGRKLLFECWDNVRITLAASDSEFDDFDQIGRCPDN